MVINRRTFNVKPGCMENSIQLIKDVVQEMGNPPGGSTLRLSTTVFGTFDVLAMEVEFEDLDAYQKYWNEVFGHPAMERFFESWNTLTAGGGTNELWKLE